MPSLNKSTSGVRDKAQKRDTLTDRELEAPKSNFGKDIASSKTKTTDIKSDKNINAKNIASTKRKEQKKKSQKQQTLISKIIYSNNNLMKIDEILQQELMNNSDPGTSLILLSVTLSIC